MLETLQMSKCQSNKQTATAECLDANPRQNEASHDFGLTEPQQTTAKDPLRKSASGVAVLSSAAAKP